MNNPCLYGSTFKRDREEGIRAGESNERLYDQSFVHIFVVSDGRTYSCCAYGLSLAFCCFVSI